jgi:hypothetical protein
MVLVKVKSLILEIILSSSALRNRLIWRIDYFYYFMHSFCNKIYGSKIPQNPVFLLKEKNEEQSFL